MSKSKFTLTKGRRARRARKPRLDEGELEETALDQVAGGGRAAAADTVSDMTSDLQLRLQDTAQKQQEAMSLLGDAMKSTHETAQAIIKNIKP